MSEQKMIVGRNVGLMAAIAAMGIPEQNTLEIRATPSAPMLGIDWGIGESWSSGGRRPAMPRPGNRRRTNRERMAKASRKRNR